MKKEILWCCTGTNWKNQPYFDWSTLSHARRDSIIKFLPTKGNFTSWDYWRKQVIKCVKVSMTLEVI